MNSVIRKFTQFQNWLEEKAQESKYDLQKIQIVFLIVLFLLNALAFLFGEQGLLHFSVGIVLFYYVMALNSVRQQEEVDD